MALDRNFCKGISLTDEQIESVMAEHGKSVSDINTKLTKATEDYNTQNTRAAGLQTQLDRRDVDLKKLQGDLNGNGDLQKKFADLQQKYDDDTKALTAKLDNQAADFATNKLFDGIKFTSAGAKKAAMADFKAAGLKLDENQKFVGADDIIKKLREDDPDSFISEDTEETEDIGETPGTPYFAAATGTATGGKSKNPETGKGFNFSFNHVRPRPDNEN